MVLSIFKIFDIFQTSDKRPVKPLQEESAKVLASRLQKFSEMSGELPDLLCKRLLTVTDTEAFLLNSSFVIHKACYDKFNDHKFERAKKRQLSKASSSHNECQTKKKRTRQSSEGHISFGQQVCMFCNEKDKFDPKHPNRSANLKLRAAAGKEMSAKAVESFTAELKEMAITLQDGKIIALLTAGDVRSLELYYHINCYASYRNR